MLYALGRWQGLEPGPARRLGLALSQGGEFAFVLFTVGYSAGALTRENTELLSIVVTLSMAATPVAAQDRAGCCRAGARGRARLRHAARQRRPRDHRRLRPLRADRGAHPDAPSASPSPRSTSAPSRSSSCSRFGSQAFYGDASRPEILDAAGRARRARLRARHRRRRGLDAHRRAGAQPLSRTCRSTRAPATAPMPTGCSTSASRTCSARRSSLRSTSPSNC